MKQIGRHLSNTRKIRLIREIFEKTYRGTESFDNRHVALAGHKSYYGNADWNTIGTDLAYLMNAVATEDPKDALEVSMSVQRKMPCASALVRLFLVEFPAQHPVWNYICFTDDIDNEDGRVVPVEEILRLMKEGAL